MLATALAFTIFLASAISFTLFTPVIGSGEDMLTLAVDFAYPVLDVVLLSISFLGLLIFMNGKLGKSWLLINLGIFMDVCGDILFSYTTSQETYYSGHFLELFYHFGYLFFLLAFYIHTKEL